jgi:hypothetical protein
MNKRGIFFSVALVFVSVGAFIALILVLNALGKATEPLYQVGERSFEITHAYGRGEALLLYVDFAARLAAQHAADLLLENGGFASREQANALCRPSTLSGYVLWNDAKDANRLCAWDAQEQHALAAGTDLQSRLAKLSPDAFPATLYDFAVIDNELLGIASAPVAMLVYPPKEYLEPPRTAFVAQENWHTDTLKLIEEPGVDVIPVEKALGPPTGEYFVRPSFRTPIPLDLAVFDALQTAAQSALQRCAGMEFDAKAVCVRQLFAGFSGPGVGGSALFSAERKGAAPQIVEDTFLFVIDRAGSEQIKFALFIP